MTVAGGATLDIGAFTHTVAGDWTSDAPGAAVVGSGTIQFNGDGTTTTGTSLGPNVMMEVVSGTRSWGSSMLNMLNSSSGSFLLAPGTTLAVNGNATFTGGEFGGSGAATLTVMGDVTMQATASTTFSAGTVIECSGNWTASAVFDPPAGTVRMVGTNAATITGGLNFFNLEVLGGMRTLASAADVDGEVTVSSGTLDIGSLTHSVIGNWDSSGGTIGGSGTIEFGGQGITTTGSSVIPNVLICTGTRTWNDSGVGQGLTVQGGECRINDGQMLTVGGSATFSAGTTFSTVGAGPHLLDVGGDVLMQGMAGALVPTSVVECGGNWTATGSFVPTEGTVRLDGGGTVTLSASGPGLDLHFHDLVIENGTRVLAGTDMLLDVETLTIEAGASFDTNGHVVQIPGTTVTVDGILEVDSGSDLQLGQGVVLTVNPGGVLKVGNAIPPGAPIAEVSGYFDGGSTGGYSLVVDGGIDAVNFLFRDMGPGGIRITQTQPIASYPAGLRGGTFVGGQGGPLLDIEQPVPVELRYLNFENGGTAVCNVKTAAGMPITFKNSGGAFSGPANECIPMGALLTWVDRGTAVGTFVAISGDMETEVRVTTSAEVDVVSFRVLRSTVPTGPFAEIASFPPLGAGGGGAMYPPMVDLGLTNGVRVYYQLTEELLHGEIRVLATTSTTPLPNVWGTLRQVGGFNQFPEVDDALVGASPNDVIRIATGSYLPFDVTIPVHILADGTGPVTIDTTMAPVTVSGVAGGTLFLGGLEIGSTATASDGLVLGGNPGIVILDDLSVGAGAGFDAVRVVDSPHVAIQTCTLEGDRGLHVTNTSTVYLSLGSVDDVLVENMSNLTYAGVTPNTPPPPPPPGSTVTALSGVMPHLDFPYTVESGGLLTISFSGDPSTILLQVLFSISNGWLETGPLFGVDMVALVNPIGFAKLFGGAGGTASTSIPIPPSPSVQGFPFSLQALQVTDLPPVPGSSWGRLSNLRDVVVVP